MKVLITDREAWLQRVNLAIQRIEKKRAKEDANYVAKWHTSVWGRIAKLFGATSPEHDWPFYPSTRDWGSMSLLEAMKVALESKDTSDIYFSRVELEAL